ncbi:polymorphic toxin type 15 domain-containing protein [Pseudomonas syringae pv. actinidifoliorum]|nr:polymorphic toxin type 15 domain-containing protein [Pseudomonas syringae pv. actinidifoliorum]MDU8520907.1 polymorphic toxin type 15 domain-containing protein [Pseudomonas syringae pv. actinidifoliorum]MDU8528348.1 polymorphic toxin type 15 domain-containing protein [Pseudomonas syringae pv. actinidifoliorum]
MFFFHMLPSWDSIRRQLDRDIAPYRGGHFRTHRNEPVPSPALIMRRFNCVRSAFDRAEWEACRILGQRFVDLDISSIIKDLIDVVTQMAMIVVGSAFVGGAAGASAGVLFFGLGAVPGGLIGAALGAQASAFILGILGLEAIAESVIDGFPRIIEYYTRGITTAWQGPREQGRNPFMGDDLAAQNSAVQEIAQGHVEVVILLLGAMVQYITRGRGNARALANEMRASAKGERLGQWMLEHEDELKKRPDLQRPEPRRGALDTQEPSQSPHRPAEKDREPSGAKPNTMPFFKVDCFEAGKLPASKIVEFKRQLKGQENGLNRLTVDEYLENIANPVKRNRTVAKIARKNFQAKLQSRFQDEYSQYMDPVIAKAESLKKAKETMASLAGLHNPDLSAGGKDLVRDFGDRQVDSSIGPQWKPRVANLKEAVEAIPMHLRSKTYLNVELHKC